MPFDLLGLFVELGLTQYTDIFLDQGFDTWESILDITESDLDTLGVKLGHRRKLQRKIANTRGLAPHTDIATLRRSSSGDSRPDQSSNDASSATIPQTSHGRVTQKRKYRRHPKSDEHAPERPPSAYVLFSNKMREDLRSQNLTFTEIAKLVGENWQSLTHSEKEPFESCAQTAKERYNRDLLEYKKTPEFRKYNAYLQDFKAKYNNRRPEKDVAKRAKLSRSNLAEHSSDSHASRNISTGDSGSDAGNSSPRRKLHSEHLTNHLSRSHFRASPAAESMASVNQDVHMTDYPAMQPAHLSAQSTPVMPPGQFVPHTRRTDSLDHSRHLPSLTDMFDETTLRNNSLPYPVDHPSYASYTGGRGVITASPVPTAGSGSRVPSLRNERSSAESTSTRSSLAFPRTPIETSLPIHALLANGKPMAAEMPISGILCLPHRTPSPDTKLPSLQPQRRRGTDGINGHYAIPPLRTVVTDPLANAALSPKSLPPVQPPPIMNDGYSARSIPPVDARLDGMSALLQAGEMVNRQGR